MRIFAENPHSVLDEFSNAFEKGYMDTLSRGHGTKRILANRVYQEYIADKNHIHMNATVWTTLTGFIKYLGKEGKAIVDETEKGWFIQYIDRDPKALARQARTDERKQADLDEEDRMRKEIEAQVRAAQERAAQEQAEGEQAEELPVEPPIAGTGLSLSLSAPSLKRPRLAKSSAFGEADDDEQEHQDANNPKKKASTLQLLLQESQAHQKSQQQQQQPKIAATTTAASSDAEMNKSNKRDACWLREGIWVKILRGEHEGEKAVVQVLFEEDNSAELRLDSGETAVITQSNLQTVVPRPGERAMVLRGPHIGKEAETLAIHKDRYCCDIRLLDSDIVVRSVDYDNMSKCCEW